MRQLGTHVLVDLCGCDSTLLDSIDAVREALMAAAEKARVTVLDYSFHKFSPQGVSGVVVLAESHISVHTWPEEQYAAVDVFTCGDEAMPHLAAAHMIQSFAPEKYRVKEIGRGVPDASGKSATSSEWKAHVTAPLQRGAAVKSNPRERNASPRSAHPEPGMARFNGGAA